MCKRCANWVQNVLKSCGAEHILCTALPRKTQVTVNKARLSTFLTHNTPTHFPLPKSAYSICRMASYPRYTQYLQLSRLNYFNNN